MWNVLQMSMSHQVSTEIQAVVALTDAETEPIPSDIGSDVPATSEPSLRDFAVINESFDDFAGNTTLSQDTSFQHLEDNGLSQDSSTQTDPVTIIIGDASFLVKKVRHSCFYVVYLCFDQLMPLVLGNFLYCLFT